MLGPIIDEINNSAILMSQLVILSLRDSSDLPY